MRHVSLFKSTAFKIAVLYMALFGLSNLAVLAVVYQRTAGFIARQTEETIEAEILGLSEHFRLFGLGGLIFQIKERSQAEAGRQSVYILADSDFSPLAGNIDRWPAPQGSEVGWMDLTLLTDKGEDQSFRARYFLLEGGFHLLVGRNVEERLKLERLIVDMRFWVPAVILFMGFFTGLLISRRQLKRPERMNQALGQIMRGDLTGRLPESGGGDEYDVLSRNVNRILGDVERLMQGMKSVTDNIAHDLRGPLNRMRARLEIALMDQKADHVGAIERALGEIDEILAVFNALLKIARTESAVKRDDFTPVDLAAVAEDMAELYGPVVEEKELKLLVDCPPELRVPGDRHLISQAVANLLDNAVKYTPKGGRVFLTLRDAGKTAVLVVADTGPGVPPEARDKVLERFFRLEQARNAPGSGLGLSLVAAAAKLHDAQLTLDDNNPGLVVTLRFPK